MSEDLRATFHHDRVDQSELEHLLLTHFGGAQSVGASEIRYVRGHDSTPALILRYGRDGLIGEIVRGPSVQSDDVAAIVEKIERHLLADGPTEIGQLVLFATVPTRGWFRYRDAFQLLPVPPEAPRPPFFIGDHPLLLQYAVKSSDDPHIAMVRRARVGRDVELLCTALNAKIRGAISTVVRHHWSLVGDPRDPVNWRSEYCQEAYMYPSANGIAPAYSSVDALGAMETIPAQTHFARIGISGNESLDVPDTFRQSLDVYFSMLREDQERFLRACFWFQYAQKVATLSYSGAFTALVSTVESLMGDAKPEAHCDACNRPIGAGPTKRFVAFVEQHAPGPAVSNQHRRALYSLRSSLAHGGRLLHADRYGRSGGMTADSLSDDADQQALWGVVRVVLVNWLLAQGSGE